MLKIIAQKNSIEVVALGTIWEQIPAFSGNNSGTNGTKRYNLGTSKFRKIFI